MQYLSSKPFTIPVNDGKVSQIDWDRAFMPDHEFRAKYGAEEDHLVTPSGEQGDQNGR